jgi:hypothetical protein
MFVHTEFSEWAMACQDVEQCLVGIRQMQNSGLAARFEHLAQPAAGFRRLKTETIVSELDGCQDGRQGEHLMVSTLKEKDWCVLGPVCDGVL